MSEDKENYTAVPNEESVSDSTVKKANFTVQVDPVLPYGEGESRPPYQQALHFYMDHPYNVQANLRDVEVEDLPSSEENRTRYSEVIAGAAQNHTLGNNTFSPFLESAEDEWVQTLEYEGTRLGLARPRQTVKRGQLSGHEARLRVNAAVGLGSVVSVPCWHTGAWLNMKAPSNATLLELERRIGNLKIDLGRKTYGAAFSNVAVFTNIHLINVALEHVYGGTIKPDVKTLKDRLLITDIPLIVWGFASSIWQDGYPMERPCVKDPTKCNHVDEAKVRLTKLMWVNNRMVNDQQRVHMLEREKEVSVKELEVYQKQHTAPQTRVLDISDRVKIKIKVPTIAEYERAGFEWIDRIVKSADEAFGQSLRGDERNTYIYDQARTTSMMRYFHFVDEVHFLDEDGQEESFVKDLDGIRAVLETLSSDRKLTNNFISGVAKFIRTAVIAAIGIPRYTCPACKGEAPEEDSPEYLPEIIQIEMNEVFFTLQYMRLINNMDLQL